SGPVPSMLPYSTSVRVVPAGSREATATALASTWDGPLAGEVATELGAVVPAGGAFPELERSAATAMAPPARTTATAATEAARGPAVLRRRAGAADRGSPDGEPARSTSETRGEAGPTGATSAEPHLAQNRAFSRAFVPHFEQVIRNDPRRGERRRAL